MVAKHYVRGILDNNNSELISGMAVIRFEDSRSLLENQEATVLIPVRVPSIKRPYTLQSYSTGLGPYVKFSGQDIQMLVTYYRCTQLDHKCDQYPTNKYLSFRVFLPERPYQYETYNYANISSAVGAGIEISVFAHFQSRPYKER